MKRFGLLITGCFVAATAFADEVTAIPLDKCTPGQVLMTMNHAALDRYTTVMKSNIARWKQLAALTDKYPNSRTKPASDFLSRDDLAEYQRISDQIGVSTFYLLAESRLDRDTMVMLNMVLDNEALRDDKPLPDAKTPEFKPYIYLAKLREILEGVDHPTVKNLAECSLNLALQNDAIKAQKELEDKLSTMPEANELIALRAKYSMPNGAPFDTVRMSPEDTTKVNVIRPKVAGVLLSYQDYIVTLNALMYYGDAVRIEYEGQRDDILKEGVPKDMTGYDKLQKTRYAALSPVMQKVINLWFYIDNDDPSTEYKNSMAIKKVIDQAAQH